MIPINFQYIGSATAIPSKPNSFDKLKGMLNSSKIKTAAFMGAIGAGLKNLIAQKRENASANAIVGNSDTYTLMLTLSIAFWLYDMIRNAMGSFVANRIEFLSITIIIATLGIVKEAFKGDKKGMVWVISIAAFYSLFAVQPNFQLLLSRTLLKALGFSSVGTTIGKLFSLRVVYPLWLLFYLYKRHTKKSLRILQSYVALLFLLLAFAGITSMSAHALYGSSNRVDFQIGSIGGGFKEGWANFVNHWKTLPNATRNFWQGSIDYATGTTPGEDEKYAEKDLGVAFKELKLSQPKFYDDEKITAWGKIHAKSLDKPIELYINCSLLKGKNETAGEVIPKSPLSISKEETIDFECRFPKQEAGDYKIKATALYHFETNARLKTYFVDKAFQKSLDETKDVLSLFGQSDRNPVATVTSGPVEVGMKTSQPLIAIYRNKENPGTKILSIEVNKKWDGEIKKINELSISTPKGISLDYETCTPEFKPAGKEDGRNLYKLTKPITEFLEDGRGFYCRFIFDNPNELFGDKKFRIDYFKMKVDYWYETSSKVEVTIIPSPFNQKGETK